MFIEGIKAFPVESNDAKMWRFRYDQGQHRNLCVVQASASEQDLIRGALRLALFNLRDPKLKGAIVHLSDSNGDTWIFERQTDQFRCFRNRQLFDGRLEVCLKELFKDYAGIPSDESSPLAPCIKEFALSFDGQALFANQHSRFPGRSSAWEKAGQQRLESNRKILESSLTGTKSLNNSQLSQILPFGDTLSKRLHSIEQQAREVEKTFEQLSRIDIQLIGRLEQERALIEKIKVVSDPLLDPAKSPRILQERLKEVEAELQEICERWQIQNLPTTDPDVDWGLALQALTRYLACDKLEKAARKSIHDARTLIKPVYDTYRASVGRFLQHDRGLIQELETCLNELGEHVRQAGIEQDRQRDNIAGRLNKLLGLTPGDGDRTKGESCLGPHSLELSRAAVNQCLQAVGRLYSELEQNQGEHDGKFLELEGRYEKIVLEFGKSRDQWITVAKQLELSPEIGVKGLVTWMNQQGKLSMLHQRRLRLQDEIQEYRSQLKTLAQHLEEWRSHTGSQKSSRLDHSGVILTEARAVLQYADKKKSQLLKLQVVASKYEAYQQIKAKIEQDRQLVQNRWREAMVAWNLPQRSLESETWEKITQAGREIMLLENLLHESSKPLKNEQIFSSDALDMPLAFYIWKEPTLANKARILLMQQVEHADDSGLGLIFTDDVTLGEMLIKMGLGRTQMVESKPEAVSTPPPKPQKTLVSEKARAALEVFATKQGGSTRNTL